MLLSYSKLLIVFVLGAITLSGCVTGGVILQSELTPETRVQRNQGIIALRIINATSSKIPLNYITLVPENLNESKEFKPVRIEALKILGGSSTFFLSTVPAGRYAIKNLRAYHASRDSSFDDLISTSIELGVFNIQAGQTTDLGSLVYYEEPQGDTYLKKVTRAPFVSNKTQITAFKPFFKYPDQVLSWEDDDNEDIRRARYLNMVQNPTTYNDIYQTPDNSIYFIGKLGFILVRSADGFWSSDAIDMDGDLNAIAQSSDGRMLLGGEYGLLFTRKHSGAPWQPVTIDPTYSVESIWFRDNNTADIITWNQDSIKILRLNFTDNSTKSTLMKELWAKRGWLDADRSLIYEIYPPPKKIGRVEKHISYVSTLAFKNQYTISVGIGSSKSDYYAVVENPKHYDFDYDFDYGNDSWKVKKSNGFIGGIDSVVDAGSVKLGYKRPRFWSWDGLPDYFIFDENNQNWKPINTTIKYCEELDKKVSQCRINGELKNSNQPFRFLSPPVFFNKSQAVAFIRYVSNTFGKRVATEDAYMVHTEDGGETWLELSSDIPGKFCTKTIPAAKDGLLVACENYSSDFYLSKDKGLNWIHTRQQVNF